jgi:asparagine synthase (glutamine-hydrolysing)
MCGICGTAGFADVNALERMVDLITHRGPNDRGVYVTPDNEIGLGNCRLSIIDLSARGHMPMSNEDNTVWISYNGETYNFPVLRQELESLGHQFRSRTDSEVIVHGYEQWGVEVFRRLNGMFALAIVDRRVQPAKLLLARDRYGIKPLYYTNLKRGMVFASEVKAILAMECVPREIDLNALHRYLAFLWTPGPETMFKGIYKLPPGHYMEWIDGRSAIRSFWNPTFDVVSVKNEVELAEELRAILKRSVARHLITDVPFGVFLSGGLDSSAIVALASELVSEPLKTYTIAYRPEDGLLEQSTGDPAAAKEVADRFKTEHHEIVVAPQVADLLPQVVWHLDEPVADAAAISTYLICQAASSELKVLLSGQGGDEVFAGYRVYGANRLARLVRALPAPVRKGFSAAVVDRLPPLKSAIPGMRPGLVLAIHRYLSKLLSIAELDPQHRFVASRSYYSDAEQSQMYSGALADQLAGAVAGDRHLAFFADVASADFLNQMLYVDLKTFLPELNLTYSDKLSAATSMEARVPLLDNEVVDFMAQVPPNLKLKGMRTKHLFKEALKDALPASILNRRKAGFGAPIRTWLRRDLRDMVDELLSVDAVRNRGYFRPAAVRELVRNDRGGRDDNSYRIWALLSLELWHRAFIDGGVPNVVKPGRWLPNEAGYASVVER